MTLPDVELIVRQFLAEQLDAPVRTRIPNPRPDTFVRVWRTGGVATNRILEGAQITVQAWATDPADASLLAREARAALHERYTRMPLVRGVDEISGLYYDPDPQTGLPRYTFTIALWVRAPRTGFAPSPEPPLVLSIWPDEAAVIVGEPVTIRVLASRPLTSPLILERGLNDLPFTEVPLTQDSKTEWHYVDDTAGLNVGDVILWAAHVDDVISHTVGVRIVGRPAEVVHFRQPYGTFTLTRTGDTVHVHIDRQELHEALSSGRGIRTPWPPTVSGVQTFPFPGGGQATLNGSAVVVTASAPDTSGNLDFDYATADPATDFSDTHMVLPISATANAGTIACDRDGDEVTLTIDNSAATASVGAGSPWGLPWPAAELIDPAPRPMPERGTVVIASTIADARWGMTFGGFIGMTPFPVPDGNVLVVTYKTT